MKQRPWNPQSKDAFSPEEQKSAWELLQAANLPEINQEKDQGNQTEENEEKFPLPQVRSQSAPSVRDELVVTHGPDPSAPRPLCATVKSWAAEVDHRLSTLTITADGAAPHPRKNKVEYLDGDFVSVESRAQFWARLGGGATSKSRVVASAKETDAALRLLNS